MVYYYILGKKNIPWFKQKWDNFMKILSSKQDYLRLDQILSKIQNKDKKWYHFCNNQYEIECDLQLDVLSDLGFIVDAFYEAFRDVL